VKAKHRRAIAYDIVVVGVVAVMAVIVTVVGQYFMDWVFSDYAMNGPTGWGPDMTSTMNFLYAAWDMVLVFFLLWVGFYIITRARDRPQEGYY